MKKKLLILSIVLLFMNCAMVCHLPEKMERNSVSIYDSKKLYDEKLPSNSKFRIDLNGRIKMKILISKNGKLINFYTTSVNEEYNKDLLEGTEFKNSALSKKQYYGAMIMKDFFKSNNIEINILRPVMDNYNSPMMQSHQIVSFIAELKSDVRTILKKYEIEN